MTATTPAPSVPDIPARLHRGRPRIAAIAWRLSRPGGQSAAAVVLPVVAFAITTALLLTVLGGTMMFVRTGLGDPDLAVYPILAGFAVALLVVPLVSLGGSAARLSARRRDDRLATLRLIGATPAQVARITVLEATAFALAGALVGAVLYLAATPAVGLVRFFGEPIGAGSLWVGLGPLGLVVAGVVLVAAASAALGLRSVVISPLGVRTKASAPRMHWLRAVVAVAVVAVVVVGMQNLTLFGQFGGMLMMVAAMLVAFAVVLAVLGLLGPWLIGVVARAQLRRARTASALIAARTVLESPKALWRQVGGVAMACFVAVVAGSGLALAGVAGGEMEAELVEDMHTGVWITLVMSFLMVACSVGVNQAAQILDRRDLYVGLDRLGTPRSVMEAARVRGIVGPLLTVVVSAVIAGGLLVLPLLGIAIVVAPATILTLLLVFAVGVGLVVAGLVASRPVLSAVLAAPERV
ncbi:FtsX-like permease family protein [Mycetocola reblochoni]|uniref:ABC3 transporter permease C-terminal domain-containing protein n=2 Tax=Mycetocola reblochoni TaxID=331618 RepID=A0A1R4IMU3_9MICO|nr:FtsX-like permease family protein [Mycetocola reblochoni]RLP67917.1 FtsX-like permease family protein [Mycetocola reblochoni]SJN21161.1 hypothetical protein FM119_02620 [Mycetocola reblochoni REB411]